MRLIKGVLLTVAVSAALAVTPAGAAAAATYKRCEPVRNPYPGTRYEGVDLTHIRARATSCRTARRVARRAHDKALRTTSPGPIERFTWKGWRVRGDLRPDHDRYLARKGTRRVRWRF